MRYLISGRYGEGNAGDEAILAGILQEIERRDGRAGFTVLSFDPEDTEARHGGGRDLSVVSTSLRHPESLVDAMRHSDLLISGGGSFLHEADFDVYGRSFLWRQGKLRPVPYFLLIVLLARSLRLPVMWYAQGLGPLHTWSARRMVGLVGSLCPVVTWRDADSAYLATQAGVRAPVQLVVPDPAYALSPAAATEVDDWLSITGVDRDRPYLAVCPRPWLNRETYLKNLASSVAAAMRDDRMQVVLIPFHEKADPPVCEWLAGRPGLAGRAVATPPVDSPPLLAGVLGKAVCVIAMRLHSGILAATAGAPAVVIDYDPKTRAFADQTRQRPWSVHADLLEGAEGRERLQDALLDTFERSTLRRDLLRRAVAPLRRQAGATASLATGLAAARGLPGVRHGSGVGTSGWTLR